MMLTRRLLFGTLGTLPLTRLARGQPVHRLTVLHMNDFHSRHLPVDRRTVACGGNPAQDSCFGGSARLATAFAQQRAAAEADGRAVLHLDAGDQFQGSLFYTAHRGMAELAVMHAVGADAMAVGNHEFDNGPAVLARFVRAARFPVLSANIDASAEPALAGLIRPYALFDRAGMRVAVVGLTTTETLVSSSPGPNIRIGDPAAALARAAADARAAGAQAVIALSHLGVLADARLGVPGIAAIVGGHSHTLLSNTEREALAPYPVPVAAGALMVQAGAYGRFLGRLDLDLDAGGRVVAYGGACGRVGMDLEEDQAVASIVAGFAAPLQEVRRRPAGVVAEGLGVAGCRVGPCRFGTMVAGVLLDAAHGAQVGLVNAGAMRNGLQAGPVTVGDVLEALPFGNTLATATLTGADLRDTIEHGLTLVGRGGFPHWAGARVEWDIARPPGQRITALEVAGPDGAWVPVEDAARYRVATNNFIRQGGDGYTALRDRATDVYDAGTDMAELVAEALASGRAR